MDGLYWKTLSKWMLWGYQILETPIYRVNLRGKCLKMLPGGNLQWSWKTFPRGIPFIMNPLDPLTFSCQTRDEMFEKFISPWCLSHRIHGTNGMFTYMKTTKNQPNVGKYTIHLHGSYGYLRLSDMISKSLSSFPVSSYCCSSLHLWCRRNTSHVMM